LGRVGVCEGEECEWLFIDTSKNHSRRFCSTTECGYPLASATRALLRGRL
jgi:predicted RNA-binding Zn ribbon-like protein